MGRLVNLLPVAQRNNAFTHMSSSFYSYSPLRFKNERTNRNLPGLQNMCNHSHSLAGVMRDFFCVSFRLL